MSSQVYDLTEIEYYHRDLCCSNDCCLEIKAINIYRAISKKQSIWLKTLLINEIALKPIIPLTNYSPFFFFFFFFCFFFCLFFFFCFFFVFVFFLFFFVFVCFSLRAKFVLFLCPGVTGFLCFLIFFLSQKTTIIFVNFYKSHLQFYSCPSPISLNEQSELRIL